jgi:predicted dehydrogenase
MVAAVHADACRSLGWPVRAVVARDLDRAAALCAVTGGTPYRVEDATGRRLGDVAIVATPPARHVDHAVSLMESGHHVVVEAPIACSLADADRLVAEELRLGARVLYCEHLVAAPVMDALLADADAVGVPTHLSARAIQAPPTWRRSSRADWGGGALFDLGVHPVGLVLRTAAEAGAGPVDRVNAVITDAGTEREHATVKLHFAGGLVATVVVGWQPGAAPDWDLQISTASAVLRAELYPAPVFERNGEPVTRPTGPPSLVDDYGYAPQLRRFWAAIRTGRGVPVTSRFGRQVLEVVAAAHWSAGRGAADVALPFTGDRDRTPGELLTA